MENSPYAEQPIAGRARPRKTLWVVGLLVGIVVIVSLVVWLVVGAQ